MHAESCLFIRGEGRWQARQGAKCRQVVSASTALEVMEEDGQASPFLQAKPHKPSSPLLQTKSWNALSGLPAECHPSIIITHNLRKKEGMGDDCFHARLLEDVEEDEI